MDLLSQLNWRYAVKEFDPTQKLSEEQWDTLQKVLQLSPSSYGLQPYKFVAVKNPELRVKLREASYGQSKVTDASHFIVPCRLDKMDGAYIEKLVVLNAEVRGQDLASLDGFKSMLLNFAQSLTPESFAIWAEKQIYLAVGNLLTSCAVLGIDAGPMEGLNPERYDEILELPAKGLHASTVAIAIGMRSSADSYAALKKVRFGLEDLFLEV